jgi:hypothetical protein
MPKNPQPQQPEKPKREIVYCQPYLVDAAGDVHKFCLMREKEDYFRISMRNAIITNIEFVTKEDLSKELPKFTWEEIFGIVKTQDEIMESKWEKRTLMDIIRLRNEKALRAKGSRSQQFKNMNDAELDIRLKFLLTYAIKYRETVKNVEQQLEM